MTSYIKGSPLDMAYELVRLKPRKPAALNQALQDYFGITHREAAGVLSRAIELSLIHHEWDGFFTVLSETQRRDIAQQHRGEVVEGSGKRLEPKPREAWATNDEPFANGEGPGAMG